MRIVTCVRHKWSGNVPFICRLKNTLKITSHLYIHIQYKIDSTWCKVSTRIFTQHNFISILMKLWKLRRNHKKGNDSHDSTFKNYFMYTQTDDVMKVCLCKVITLINKSVFVIVRFFWVIDTIYGNGVIWIWKNVGFVLFSPNNGGHCLTHLFFIN